MAANTDAEQPAQAGPAQPGEPPHPGNRISGPGLRVSDAERDAVAAELAEHLKDGRLGVAEFDERLSQAIGARTRGDLDRVLTDLPLLALRQPPAPARAGLPFPVVAIAIFVAGMFLLGGASRAAAASGHPVWAIWWLWWLIPFAILAARRGLGGHRPHG